MQYCIFVWNDKKPSLNNQLIDSYMIFIELSEQGVSASDADRPVNSPNETFIRSLSSARNYKQLLIYFLNEINNYDPSYALSKLDLENYAEERAIVLGKLGIQTEKCQIAVFDVIQIFFFLKESITRHSTSMYQF